MRRRIYDNVGEFNLVFKIDAGEKYFFNKFTLIILIIMIKNDFKKLKEDLKKWIKNYSFKYYRKNIK